MCRSSRCRGGWATALVAAVIAGNVGMGIPAPARAETRFTPSVNFSQRYDSNVFYGPKEFIPPNRQAWDLVSTLGTQAQLVNKSRLGDSILSVGLNGSAFAYNTDLAFISTNVFAASDLTDWMSELAPGLKLKVSDAFQYTPEPPAFLTGGKPSELSDVFSRGIQAVRANTFTNTFTAQGEYAFTRSAGFRTDYSHSFFKVGQIFLSSLGGVPVAFFDTSLHSVTAGPTVGFDGGDTLFFKYNYVAAETSGQGVSIRYAAHTLAPEYLSRAIAGWQITLSGGATMVEQVSNRTFLSGKVAVATNWERPTRIQLSLSRQAAPAFFGAGGALISNTAQLAVSHKFSKILRLNVFANYAYNESAPVDVFTFKSITGTATLEYNLTRSTILALSQEYNRFTYTGVPTFDRHATLLSIRTEWK